MKFLASRTRVLLLFLLSTACHLSLAVDFLPFASGEKKSSDALATYEVQIWGQRGQLPLLNEREEPVRTDGTISTPGEAAFIQINASTGGLNFRTSGFQDNAEKDRWIPLLVITPKAAGTYKLAGEMKFFTDEASEQQPDAQNPAIVWYVLKISGEGTELVFEGKPKHDEVVSMETLPELQAISLADGGSLALAVTKNGSWNAVGASLEGFTFEKSKTPEQAPRH